MDEAHDRPGSRSKSRPNANMRSIYFTSSRSPLAPWSDARSRPYRIVSRTPPSPNAAHSPGSTWSRERTPGLRSSLKRRRRRLPIASGELSCYDLRSASIRQTAHRHPVLKMAVASALTGSRMKGIAALRIRGRSRLSGWSTPRVRTVHEGNKSQGRSIRLRTEFNTAVPRPGWLACRLVPRGVQKKFTSGLQTTSRYAIVYYAVVRFAINNVGMETTLA
jgi:hypothetical protein